ncbi:pyruvate dehydrogenase complex dihydrolipoamide acetyltransferase [Mesorhizobium sp. YM1C-6-2]|uniref:pyruvate dehydrogenase complex dihydrolipoamide acetyltransferase n=1 Tax=Mesorhizobium sp. YM1C-6-2 TaxID=1827501 RepID=UPI000EF2750D|nr:pyruvate dehydrogenase complex dihydrolipoamide acetyltransferase [Mesorhizobium sp. YM1C-6-2]RLP28270.1 pyruvate dehydrogenase complex dihydrolipoamide acetyltransferase [Mesorhizobium sp. YM1C-6-2]
MPVEVILPKVDMDMATGQISRWFVAEGATVKQGDLLFEIETDKAAMEIDSPASGTLRDIVGKEGVDIPVGSPVAWIYAEGETVQDMAPTSPSAGGGRAEGAGGDDTPSTPNAKPETATPTPALRAAPLLKGEGGTRATPLARRIARENNIALADIAGSGPYGRIVRADVEAAVAGLSSPLQGEVAAKRTEGIAPEGTAVAPSTGFATPPDRPAPAVKPMSDDAVLKLFEEGSYELVPHDNMRKTIARRLVEAKSTIPHFYLTLDCEIDALLALRTQINAAAPVKKTEKGEVPAYKVSVNDMVIKAMALALRDVPTANVSWTETAMVQHKHADVGVAVSIPGGLITPIIRKADEKTLSVIANEMKDLAARARTKKLKPEEYQGGTTAVSNLGMFGIKDFSAVINLPHATILAVGAGEERAVVKNGEIKIATIMSVTLSTDHRAVDGALGAELLVAFKRHIENPLGILV